MQPKPISSLWPEAFSVAILTLIFYVNIDIFQKISMNMFMANHLWLPNAMQAFSIQILEAVAQSQLIHIWRLVSRHCRISRTKVEKKNMPKNKVSLTTAAKEFYFPDISYIKDKKQQCLCLYLLPKRDEADNKTRTKIIIWSSYTWKMRQLINH